MMSYTLIKLSLLRQFAALGMSILTSCVLAHPEKNDVPEWAKSVAPWPTVSESVKQNIINLLATPKVQKALDFLKNDEELTLQQNITLTEIPAPPFHEEKKAKAFLNMMREAGIKDAYIDKEGNVIGIRKGTGNGPLVVLDAHLDTVFPLGTDLKVTKRGNKYYGPGITDDTRGLAVLLSWIRALNSTGLNTVGDLMFVGSVGEEGNGDLRGVKALFRDHKNIDAFIGLESIPMGAVLILNTGSVRYEVTFSAPGGHSYGAFGEVPSAIHAMGRAIAKIADIKVPKTPRTTYNVGIVRGGTSVNTISPDAVMEVDMRSDGAKELQDLNKRVLSLIQQSVDEENKFIGKNMVSVTFKKIGERPGGMTPHDSSIVQIALQSMRVLGQKELLLAGGSTNAGVPVSLGVPTVILPPGGKFEGFHALTEAMDPTDGYKGAQIALLTALASVGVEGGSQPLIKKNK